MVRKRSIPLPVVTFIIALFAAFGGVAAQPTPETKASALAPSSNQDGRDSAAALASDPAIADALAKNLIADPKLRQAVVAAAGHEQARLVNALIFGFFVLFCLVMVGVAFLQWRFQRAVEKVIDSAPAGAAADDEPGKSDERPTRNMKIEALRLLQSSPVGVPEGTVRAVLSFVLIAGGLVILMLKNRLGLEGAAEVAGVLGTVLGFYFGSRAGSDTSAQQTAQQAIDTATRATEKAVQVQAKVEASGTALQQAATIRALESGAGGAAEVEVTREQTRLREIREKLRTAQQIVRVVGAVSSGSTVVEGSAKVMDQADKMLGIIEPLLSGKPGIKEIADVATKASASLAELQKAGLPGVFGDAIATIGAVASTVSTGVSTATALGGILGGPAGIVGALVFSGLRLYQDKQKFDQWDAAVLQRPFDRNLMPTSDFENVGLLALEYAPLMRARLVGGATQADPALAAAVLRAAVQPPGAATPTAAIELARTLRTPGSDPDLSARFASDGELAEAIEEYRQGVVFMRAKDNLPRTIELGVAATGAPKTIDLHAVLDLIPLLRRDRRAASEIDRLSTVVNALGEQNAIPLEQVLAFVGDALREGEATATQDRQATEPATSGS
jgi:hypothetical protein